MHPGIFAHWKRAREAARECAEAHPGHGDCGGHHGWHATGGHGHDHGSGHGHGFGVRRPLRFMARRLDLDDEQIERLARILNDLKLERSQGAVDHNRAVSAIADVLEAESFDAAAAEKALDQRVEASRRLEKAVLATLEATHAMLQPDQRVKLAYLLRSGALTI